MKHFFLLSFLILSCTNANVDKKCLCLEVIDSNNINQERLVSITLDEKNKACWSQEMVLIKKTKEGNSIIPYQLDQQENTKIWFKYSSSSETKITYCFANQKNQNSTPLLQLQKENGDLKLKYQEQSFIHYRYAMKLSPKGISPLYQKSGYIHPIISPNGDTLTRIQAPDHYHHYGVWGPWTRTRIDNVGVDFWNLKDSQGTVLFKKFNNLESGIVYAGFNAHQEHINTTQKGQRQVAINEELKVKVWKNNNPNQYFIDYTSQFSSPLKNGILLESYRYGGGLGFRFKEQWVKDNCAVLTSEGKNRLAADGTSARWCMVSGAASKGNAKVGVLFMSHPNNQSHPEPMRVWPLNANKGRGDMFFEFCPIRHKEWKIEPEQSYVLNYRMLVFDGELTPEEAEDHWKAFAFQPEIDILKN